MCRYQQGHIALDTLVIPEGTLGSRVDCVARLALWQAGLDYNHGTGHGVGSFLNVHEGPQGIGFRKRDNEVVSELSCIVLFCVPTVRWCIYGVDIVFILYGYSISSINHAC